MKENCNNLLEQRLFRIYKYPVVAHQKIRIFFLFSRKVINLYSYSLEILQKINNCRSHLLNQAMNHPFKSAFHKCRVLIFPNALFCNNNKINIIAGINDKQLWFMACLYSPDSCLSYLQQGN